MPRQWKDVCLTPRITIQGGYSSTPFPLKTMEFPDHNGESATFVHISKGEEWILQTVVGKYDRHAMKRSQLLDQMKMKVGLDCRKTKKEAVGAEVDEDPMSLLDAFEEPVVKKKDLPIPQRH